MTTVSVVIPGDLYQAVVRYLGDRPYKEVAGIIAQLDQNATIAPVPAPEPEAPEPAAPVQVPADPAPAAKKRKRSR